MLLFLQQQPKMRGAKVAGDAVDWGAYKELVPVLTFVLGFLAARFTLSKKERFDVSAQKQSRAEQLAKDREAAFQEFYASMQVMANKEVPLTLDDFAAVDRSGGKYFGAIVRICDAILADQLPNQGVRNTMLQTVKEAIERSLPDFYRTLRDIAKSLSLSYGGEFRRMDYESVFVVYEKFRLNELPASNHA